jgi:hypothetical protein
MRNLLIALAALALLAACESLDPTQKEDMSCTSTFESVSDVCSQLRITSAEAVVAEAKCTGDLHGSWSTTPCTSTNRMAGGYCKVEASQYSLSGTDVKVYFYDPVTLLEAQAACAAGEGTWID